MQGVKWRAALQEEGIWIKLLGIVQLGKGAPAPGLTARTLNRRSHETAGTSVHAQFLHVCLDKDKAKRLHAPPESPFPRLLLTAGSPIKLTSIGFTGLSKNTPASTPAACRKSHNSKS